MYDKGHFLCLIFKSNFLVKNANKLARIRSNELKFTSILFHQFELFLFVIFSYSLKTNDIKYYNNNDGGSTK